MLAYAAGAFDRIRLQAKVQGPAGNDIPIAASTNSTAQVILTAFNSVTCCANKAGSRVTTENPAIPGETISVMATGLGFVIPDDGRAGLHTGGGFDGNPNNTPLEFVSSLAGGRTANVIFARLLTGAIGVFEVQLELNTDLPSNPATQLTIAQSFQVSNIITFPLVKPN